MAYGHVVAGDGLMAGADADHAAARREFEAVVALPRTGYHAFAHARLAALSRYEGRPWEGLRHVRLAIECGAEDDDSARPLVHFEDVRCHLELGLGDRVADAAAALLAENPPGSPMYGDALLAMLDTCLALDDWRRVQRLARGALQDTSPQALDPSTQAKVRLRSLIAARELAPAAEDLARVAAELEAAAATIADARIARAATILAADARLDAGEFAEVERILAGLSADDAGDPRQEGHVLALRARVARSRSADRPTLDRLRLQLEAVHERWLSALATMPMRSSGYGLFNDRATFETLATLAWLDALVLEPDAAAEAILWRTEEFASLGTLSRRLGGKAAAFTDLLDLRPERGGVLSITLGPHTATLVLVDQQTSVHEVELDVTFWRDAVSLLRAVDEGPRRGQDVDFVRGLATRVAARLLPDAVRARLANWRSLVLIGSEQAAAMVQAMPWQDSWLCLRMAITHAPSVSLATALRQRSQARAGADAATDLCVFADPKLGTATCRRWGVEPLRVEPGRLASLSAAFPRERVVSFVGDQATAAAFADPRVKAARLLCILGHGTQDFELERSACLLVAGSDPAAAALDSVAIERFEVPPIVLLGVCEAAAGPERRGDDGAQHLGGAFLSAGANCVVLAPGRLALGATRELLSAGLRHWRGGASMAEAVRLARVEVAASAERAHPYYFAGLRVFGSDAASPGR
ncbi:MAG: CHAT domain-containing protein [Planctomycetes bacterium]|nr:CHAT domain-containing protein [Planctomycetota bacterium]